ncbi:MAG: helix-hairpin-helix domain-containing protein [Clostridia bacterium]|nr:helix-hairpin-helix domain-containing protein [Clostridia bacterium]
MKKPQIFALCLVALFLGFAAGYFAGASIPGGIALQPSAPSATPSPGISAPADGRIDINTAELSDLILLPGIGEKLARDIIDYRTQYGPFARPEDLCKVPGIGQKKFAALQDYICTAEDGNR